jgi:DNA-directed RNA polymerase subunit RPC12/RpoP
VSVGAGHVRPEKQLTRSGAVERSMQSDYAYVSEKYAVECLRCGNFRTAERERTERLDPGECPRCGYVGWALAADISESARRTLRERPLEWRSRRLRPV